MSRVCTICAHDEREGIDAALVQGTSYRTIAHQYDVSRYALMRHARDHLPGKMLTFANIQPTPRATAREPHQGKMLSNVKVQPTPRVRARAATGRATRRRVREQLQAEYAPQLADVEREVEALQRRIGDLRRDLKAERKRRSEAEGSGTSPAVPVPMPEPEHNEARGVGVRPAGIDPAPEQSRMWGI